MADSISIDLHELKAKLAYQHWEARGRPFGSPEIDWFAAAKGVDSAISSTSTDLFSSDIRMGPDEGPCS
jgi:hypothetical protein